MELRGHSDIHSKQKIKMPLKEKKQKDGARTIRFKKVRRVGPPFSEYLEGNCSKVLVAFLFDTQ